MTFTNGHHIQPDRPVHSTYYSLSEFQNVSYSSKTPIFVKNI